jgi:hypothetical protein
MKKEENKETIVLNLPKRLFWDVNPYEVNLEKNASFIVDRVIARGDWEDFKRIIEHYGKIKVAEYATALRYMNNIDLAFCSTYFNIKKEKFRCYEQKQLQTTHWNY